ncbi:MAG: hypothetical protein U9R56_03415 [candidate division Zixibacteria bacterium]|nr:hypothetical protein [candidate division Zixibacteria bacterium]
MKLRDRLLEEEEYTLTVEDTRCALNELEALLKGLPSSGTLSFHQQILLETWMKKLTAFKH